MSFTKQVAGFAKDVMDKAEKTYRGSILEAFAAVVEATPVGQPSLWKGKAPKGYTGGRLRGNWQVSIGSPKGGELERKGGGGPSAEINAMAARVGLEDKAVMTNNLPYAVAVENGHSTQARGGMVKQVVREWNRVVARNAKRAKK